MKKLTAVVYVCVAGVVLSFAGSIYTGIQIHREKNRPQPTVFPTPAMDANAASAPAAAPVSPGGLPTPAN